MPRLRLVADGEGVAKEVAAKRLSATFRLVMMEDRCPELREAVQLAKLDLVAAIMEMDAAIEAEEEAKARGDNPRPHSLFEQQAVNVALQAYGNALADLVRGGS